MKGKKKFCKIGLIILVITLAITGVVITVNLKQQEKEKKTEIVSKKTEDKRTKEKEKNTKVKETIEKEESQEEETTTDTKTSNTSDSKKSSQKEVSTPKQNNTTHSNSETSSDKQSQETQTQQQSGVQPQPSQPQAPQEQTVQPQTEWEKLGITEYEYYNAKMFDWEEIAYKNIQDCQNEASRINQKYSFVTNYGNVAGKYINTVGCWVMVYVNGKGYYLNEFRNLGY